MKIGAFRLKPLIISIIIPLALGGLVGFLLRDDIKVYAALEKPPLSPPGLVFPIVWSILYLLMGISCYLVYDTPHSSARTRALQIYAVQLAVNLIWPFLFFRREAFLAAFAWIILLDVLVTAMIVSFHHVRPRAAYLQIPYLIWILFASYLNFGVWFLN